MPGGRAGARGTLRAGERGNISGRVQRPLGWAAWAGHYGAALGAGGGLPAARTPAAHHLCASLSTSFTGPQAATRACLAPGASSCPLPSGGVEVSESQRAGLPASVGPPPSSCSAPELTRDPKPSKGTGGDTFLEILKNPLWVDRFGNHYHIPLDLKPDQNLQGEKKKSKSAGTAGGRAQRSPSGARAAVQGKRQSQGTAGASLQALSLQSLLGTKPAFSELFQREKLRGPALRRTH